MPPKVSDKKNSESQLATIEARFEKNMHRHKGITWSKVLVGLEKNPKKMQTLVAMEETGGEPDIIGVDKKSGEFVFCDCSPETPAGRRSLCYDREALNSRKEHKPKNTALDLAKEIGIEILDEVGYQELQKLGPFDQKSSSWIKTPPEIRKLGGAIFGDYRFGRTFVYHNGADSYYAVRGFRGILKV